MSQILHKEYDFTRPGGFPLTQDRLKFMQEATGEAIRALIATAGDHEGPYILSGMKITEPSPGDINITDGWFIYRGKIVKFAGVTLTPGSYPVWVQITNLTTDLIFYTTITQPVQLSTLATAILDTTGTVSEDDTHFLLSDAVEWAVAVGRTHYDDWIIIEDDMGATLTNVSLKYRRNRITNTVHIRGTLTVADAHGFSGDEALSLGIMQYLPEGMGFLEMINIPNYIHSGGGPIKNHEAIDYITSIPITIISSGAIYASILRPDMGTSEYRVFINHIFSLD